MRCNTFSSVYNMIFVTSKHIDLRMNHMHMVFDTYDIWENIHTSYIQYMNTRIYEYRDKSHMVRIRMNVSLLFCGYVSFAHVFSSKQLNLFDFYDFFTSKQT